jgi:ketosteroid isomerase-like protein
MSQGNVEVVRDAYEALATRGLDAFSAYWATDIDWQTMRHRWWGREAGRAYLQELFDLFDDLTAEPLELIDAGDDRVVIYLRYGGRSKRGGIPVPPEYFAIVIRVRDGAIAQASEYATRQEALEAVGLSE